MPNEIDAWVDWKYPRFYINAEGNVILESKYAIAARLGISRQSYKRAELAFGYGSFRLIHSGTRYCPLCAGGDCDFRIRNIKPEEKMLDLTKKYRTRDGREVTDLRREGEVLIGKTGTTSRRWNADGTHIMSDYTLDLVPACDPIVLGRKYKTAKGEPVELFKIADGRAWGRFQYSATNFHTGTPYTEWRSFSWDVNDHTLVPAVRKEKRVYWLRHCSSAGDVVAKGYESREQAERSNRLTRKHDPITGPHEIEIEVED
jgi:hypothetical protein